jgi:copper/silver efflux system protein
MFIIPGVIMLLYLDVAYDRWDREGRMNSLDDLEAAMIEGGVERVRPKMMTVMATLTGLLPIMWSSGTGADMMKRIAAPMVGGIVTSFLLELLIYPSIYTIWKRDLTLASGSAPDQNNERFRARIRCRP